MGGPPPSKPAPGRRCPVCKRAESPEHAPFCSARCAEIDLGRWLSGGYRIATDERPGDGGEGADEEAEPS